MRPHFLLFMFVTAVGVISTDSLASPSAYTWVSAVSTAPWPPRYGHATVVFGDKLWILGGRHDRYGDQYDLNDVWSSVDGSTWTCIAVHAGWTGRYDHSAVVFKGKIWVLGGAHGYGVSTRDVWCSPDGENWELVAADVPWSLGSWQAAAEFSDQLWIIGGLNSLEGKDVWRSTDGLNWALVTQDPPWRGRCGHAACVFDGRLWIMGGWPTDSSITYQFKLNDVWWTTDGVNWTEATENAAWPGRVSFAATVFGGSMWVLGGQYTDGFPPNSQIIQLNDVWRSSDGVNWIEVPGTPWEPRSQHTVAAFNDKLWMLGGNLDVLYESMNDVWYMCAQTATIRSNHGSWYQEGEPLDLKLETAGISEPASYQWMKDAAPIGGATTDAYHVDAVDFADAGSYGCQVTDQSKAVITADPVQIIVVPVGSLPVSNFSALLAGAAVLGCGTYLSRRRKDAKG